MMRIPFTMNHIRLTSCRAQGRFAREQLPRAWPCRAMCAIWVNEFEELWRPDDRFGPGRCLLFSRRATYMHCISARGRAASPRAVCAGGNLAL
jgi:hypothetical protein